MMKNTLRNILFLLLLFVTSVSFAADHPKFSVRQISKTAFVLNLNNVEGKTVLVKLKDLRENVVLEETLSFSKSIRRQYNLKNLTSGTYILMVDFGSVIKAQPLFIVRTELAIDRSDLMTIYKPVFDIAEHHLDVNMLCTNLSRVTFEFVDQAGNVTYSETVEVENTLGKSFDLSQLDPGKYKLSLGINERGIQKRFSKKITIE